ncbi:MAG TPA: vitamin K epoxide reductase family protein [Solirubrobacteraceae bacterium]|nr:vitamin K epoxide reductase family protein [Solirubrobacteraceae bacterium]
MSPRALRTTMIVLATIGLGVASYLTYIHYAGIKPLCGTNGGGCEIVQTSEYSKLAGVPVATIGLIGYFFILGSLLAPESETSRFATVAFTLVGFGFSLYLTYRELFSIHHICEWCVSSAVIVTILMCLSVWRFLRGDPAARGAQAELARGDAATPAAAS